MAEPNRDVTLRDIALVILGFVTIGSAALLSVRGTPFWVTLPFLIAGAYLSRPLWWFWD